MTASITPFLWFTDDCEKAVDFYLGIFKDGQRHETMTANAAGPWPAGTIVYRAFTINGQRMIAFTGGPGHEFNDAISLFVTCADQAEIDYYWNALLADGGSELACGWLKDRYGVRWQIVPVNLAELLSHPKAMHAMMRMQKMHIAALKAAATS